MPQILINFIVHRFAPCVTVFMVLLSWIVQRQCQGVMVGEGVVFMNSRLGFFNIINQWDISILMAIQSVYKGWFQ